MTAWGAPAGGVPSKHLLPCLFILLTVSGILWGAGSASASGVPEAAPEYLQRLEEGEVPVTVRHADGPSKGTVAAAILIEAPPPAIWSVMRDCEAIPDFVPGVEECEVLAAGKDWEIIRHRIRWVWLFPKLTYVFKATYRENRDIVFSRIEGDLREMKGRWRLQPLDGGRRTIVRYSVFLDPGFLVPQWLVRFGLKGDLPEVLRALRSRVQSRRSEPREGRP